MMIPRRLQARQIREDAAEFAYLREHPPHINNGEEFKYRTDDNSPSHIANFTKGLPHHPETGLLLNSADYRAFVLGIQSGNTIDFARTPLGPADLNLSAVPNTLSVGLITPQTAIPNSVNAWQSAIAQGADGGNGAKVRAWESAGAGLTFDLEGFDAQALTMPPAPTLDSPELAAEISEVYLQALLRDVHFSQFRDPDLGTQLDPPVDCPNSNTTSIIDAINILNQVTIDNRNWFNSDETDYLDLFDSVNLEAALGDLFFRSINLTEAEAKRKRPRVTVNNLFRGIAPGDEVGPYLSQFLLVGNRGINGNDTVLNRADGFIRYGSVRIDNRVRTATPCINYMTTFPEWLDVQNGADVRGLESYTNENETGANAPYRFITTPRDLATYVHYDALYEAYLNACLILLGMGAPFDPGIPFQDPDVEDKQQGFATFGGPVILTLVCEVATRALKAVRYQKFNVHRRLRPEGVGGLIDRYLTIPNLQDGELQPIAPLVEALQDVGLLNRVNEFNNGQSYLLPMAFPEGSPMHPSYGAGHATVAGACVTILKAFFDHGWQLPLGQDAETGQYIAYEPNADGSGLVEVLLEQPLTVEGELNKVAANISIGRNWAGVHYFTDYIESLRLGEQIAIGILEEQKFTFGENFTMTVPLFDGGARQI
ncbi:vanadium-dependent haloperoxidase [Crocosphaera sp.]|uniref:vanadium-dependent haloperoxidase n=1 Tax=Crocosphaera sp. TaxID=2729996 RepID=UPI0026049B7F|nr:vanadium-dependent haloperoxidase [Crocosphaera sp.]MDJ0583329.1 vanadium-dependent haloperoxidase [Crocosphaera sp.]